MTYTPYTGDGNGNGLTVKINVNDIERNVELTVEVGELRKIELSFILFKFALSIDFLCEILKIHIVLLFSD